MASIPRTRSRSSRNFPNSASTCASRSRSYSSGMRARLAFAISMVIEFDCFLIDEIIAVGDARFHEKCHRELFERARRSRDDHRFARCRPIFASIARARRCLHGGELHHAAKPGRSVRFLPSGNGAGGMKRVARAADVGARHAWLWRHRDASEGVAIGERPRLLVDVSAIIRHDAQTGIQRVVRAVWSELAQPRSTISKSFRSMPRTREATAMPQSISCEWQPRVAGHTGKRSSGRQVSGLGSVCPSASEISKTTESVASHGASIHLVVYDYCRCMRPDWFNRPTTGHFRRWFEVLAKEADQAICISDQVARDLRQQLTRMGCGRQPTIGRLRMGSDIAASVPSIGTCTELKRLLDQIRFRPAVIMVGTVEPRKGYDFALPAFEHLWRTRPKDAPDLVIVGKSGWKTAGLQEHISSHPERGRRLHWFDRISDEGLCLLYGACKGLLMASRGEGFGLPLIEAAMHRRHVLARDLPVFREQQLPNVLFFNDDAPTALGERLLELVSLGQEQEAPAADLPAWSDCVDGLLGELGLRSEPALHQVEPPLRIAS